MLIIVNSAFDDEQNKNSDDLDDDDDDDHIGQLIGQDDIEMALLTTSANSNHHLQLNHISDGNSCNEMNESTNDTEELDTSDNNTTANTQTTAECDDDKLLLPVNGDDKPSKTECSSANEDDDSNSKENYDMNDDDCEDSFDDIKRNKHDAYNANDVQCIDETEQLVNNGDYDDCDYYAMQNGGDSNHMGDILKKTHNGDGIIANHFIGLYSIPRQILQFLSTFLLFLLYF